MRRFIFVVLTIILTMFGTSAYAADSVNTNNYDEFCGRYDITATLRMSFPDEYFDTNMKIVNDVLSDKRTALIDPNNLQEQNYLYASGLILLPYQLQAYEYQEYKMGLPNTLFQQAVDAVKKKETKGKDDIMNMEIINTLNSGFLRTLE